MTAAWGRLAVAVALLALAGPMRAYADDDDDAGPKPPNRAVEVDGQPGLKLDPETLRKNGIVVTVLQPAPWQNRLRGYGTVLDPTPLAQLASGLAVARARLQTAQARLTASQTAFERAGTLYHGQQNVSLAQLQSAQAAYRGDQATLAEADTQTRTLETTAILRFGPVLGRTIADGGPLLDDLLARRRLLVRVTLPSGTPLQIPPKQATLDVATSANRGPIDFLSPASSVDPRIQGASYLYVAPASTAVLPGMSVLVSLPAGPPLAGLAVPRSAVLWWEGLAWIYREPHPGLFVRTQIDTSLPSGDGGYIVRGLARTTIVTEGAQLLLSEEFRAQLQGGDDD